MIKQKAFKKTSKKVGLGQNPRYNAHGKLSKCKGGDASSNSHERHNEQHASHRQLFGFLVRRKKKKKKCF